LLFLAPTFPAQNDNIIGGTNRANRVRPDTSWRIENAAMASTVNQLIW